MIASHERWAARLAARWLRPDAARFMRPDAQKYMRPDAARYLRPTLEKATWRAPDTCDDVGDVATCERKYSADQPRVPAGVREGGQWARVAGAAGGGARGSRAGSNFPGASYSQTLRLEQAVARTERTLSQVRRLDPTWQPRVTSVAPPGSVEGAIRHAEARADAATARLDQLRSGIGGNFGPPLRDTPPSAAVVPSARTFDGPGWIAAYRTVNSRPDLFGDPSWSSNQGTVAVTEINGQLVFGTNSGAPVYEGRFEANAWRDRLIREAPNIMATGNIGEIPNDALYHAETTVLLKAAAANGGTLAGQTLEIHVDNAICRSCELVVPEIAKRIGNPTVTVIDSLKRSFLIKDGLVVKRGN